MRGGGGPVTAGAAGRGATATGACGATAAIDGEAGAGGATAAGGGGAERTGAATVGAGAGGANVGRSATGAGTTSLGGTTTTGGTGGGGVGRAATGGATTGLATTGGATGRTGAGGAVASFCCVMAFRTSPGREIFDKSILVLISSSPRDERAALAAGDCASDAPRMCTRTFSASFSSRELECVFFSVTPTAVSASRMALLLTSSSLARSLIRTLLIRPFLYPALCLDLHRNPHGASVLHMHARENLFARALDPAMTIQFFRERG
jgi:hypothetical protein